MSAPCVVLVGRPNVGKSTIFNKLTKRRDALVANVPGLTRDRRYGAARLAGLNVSLIDTGGLFGDHDLVDVLGEQTRLAVAEADVVVAVFDGRDGVRRHREVPLAAVALRGEGGEAAEGDAAPRH